MPKPPAQIVPDVDMGPKLYVLGEILNVVPLNFMDTVTFVLHGTIICSARKSVSYTVSLTS